jgi:hypothetical protein
MRSPAESQPHRKVASDWIGGGIAAMDHPLYYIVVGCDIDHIDQLWLSSSSSDTVEFWK